MISIDFGGLLAMFSNTNGVNDGVGSRNSEIQDRGFALKLRSPSFTRRPVRCPQSCLTGLFAAFFATT